MVEPPTMLAIHQRSLGFGVPSIPTYMLGSSLTCGMSAFCVWKWSSSSGRKSSAVAQSPFSSTVTRMPRAVRTRAAVAPPAPLPTTMASGCSDAMAHLRPAAPEVLSRPVRAEPAPHHGIAVAVPARIGEAALDAVVAHGREEAPLVEPFRQALGLAALKLPEQHGDLHTPE